jgi:uncharacterized membrane protein (GlpM family)
MNSLFWFLSNSAHRECLVFLPVHALIAWSDTFLNAQARHLVAIGAGVHQGLVQIETHMVYMLSGFLIIKSIDHQVKLLEEFVAESILLNASEICLNFHVWILFFYLQLQSGALGLVHVLSSEQKLPIEV